MIKKMYVNNSNKLSKSERFTIIRRWNNGWKITRMAKRFCVSRTTIHKIIGRYKIDGVLGLQDHIPGKQRIPLNPNFYANVVSIRKRTSWGACKIEKYFKKKGFSVSHNKINQVIQYENLTKKKLGKKGKPKYVSYEADEINDQWHIDWSIDPISKKKLLGIIDDKSRFIVYVGLFNEATAKNSAMGLQKAIDTFGAPKELVSDNGLHFKKSHQEKIACTALLTIEKKYAIKHIFIRPYYPQSNGKIERWFGSYKGEFPLMNHPNVKDMYTWAHYYNFERLHQSLDYETPAHVYLGVNSM